MNIIGATRWQSEGWATRAGLEMLPPTHTPGCRHAMSVVLLLLLVLLGRVQIKP